MEPDLIYDVGAHRGEDTEFYLKKGFRVFGVEANPALHQYLQTRFAGHVSDGRLRLANCAVAAENGPITFYSNTSATVWGTTSPEWVARNTRLGTQSIATTVQGRRFDELLRDNGIPYYMKVDIEGADLLCLEALHHSREKPKYVSIESSITSWSELLREFAILRNLGYRRFKIVNQLEVPSQVPPSPAREGQYATHAFPDGATGLFGEEAPGKWLSEREAINAYRRIFIEYRLFGNDGILSTFNWKRPLIWRLERFLPRRKWHDTHAAL